MILFHGRIHSNCATIGILIHMNASAFCAVPVSAGARGVGFSSPFSLFTGRGLSFSPSQLLRLTQQLMRCYWCHSDGALLCWQWLHLCILSSGWWRWRGRQLSGWRRLWRRLSDRCLSSGPAMGAGWIATSCCCCCVIQLHGHLHEHLVLLVHRQLAPVLSDRREALLIDWPRLQVLAEDRANQWLCSELARAQKHRSEWLLCSKDLHVVTNLLYSIICCAMATCSCCCCICGIACGIAKC